MGSRESSFGYRIGQLHRLIRLHIRTDLQPLGLRAGQVPFLAELFREEGLIQDELSALLHIDKAATARALWGLEEGGFVVRLTNPDNRRQKRIYLTDKARAVEEEFFAPLHDVTRHLSEGFTDREREMAITLLDRMIRNLQQPAPCTE